MPGATSPADRPAQGTRPAHHERAADGPEPVCGGRRWVRFTWRRGPRTAPPTPIFRNPHMSYVSCAGCARDVSGRQRRRRPHTGTRPPCPPVVRHQTRADKLRLAHGTRLLCLTSSTPCAPSASHVPAPQARVSQPDRTSRASRVTLGSGFLRVPQLTVSPGGPLPDSPEPELRAIATHRAPRSPGPGVAGSRLRTASPPVLPPAATPRSGSRATAHSDFRPVPTA